MLPRNFTTHLFSSSRRWNNSHYKPEISLLVFQCIVNLTISFQINLKRDAVIIISLGYYIHNLTYQLACLWVLNTIIKKGIVTFSIIISVYIST